MVRQTKDTHRSNGFCRPFYTFSYMLRKRHAASGIYLVTGEESTRDYYERFGYTTVETKRSSEVVAYHMFRPNKQLREGDH